MSNTLELPDNVAMLTTSSRCWNGVNVDLIEYTCTGRVQFQLKRHEGTTRLGTKLEEVGRGHAEPRSAPDVPNPHPYTPRPMYVAPAEMELWGYAADARYLKCAAISFDARLLRERLGLSGSLEPVDVPRLRFSDDRVWTLINLLTDAIDDADPASQLYGDSLIAAIAARLFERPRQAKGGLRGLSTIQLRDAIAYLEANMPARVELAALAELAGLSQSHYCRAFKASTGLAPYQWQLQARIERAKGLLLNTNRCLEEVAEATGFADAVHFGRTFRRMTGATPAAWRMDRLS
ncbi:helix-turn-helix domain-containing protein [Telluria beijingensis]|uniref:helix-turn-helix domain-containing protein n=1 Tax=Telluria beijingensis TaxID=3068633 RepID=UPI00279602BD|nr:AraC family transcriptional regulator [Massilia sp. REN29]